MPWWGDFSINNNQRMCWQLGERAIVIERLAGEWQIWNVETKEENNEKLSHGDWTSDSDLDNAFLSRHLQQHTSEQINILPALADRPVVARPSSPLRVLPGEHIRLYVSVPLWFQVSTLPSKATLLDIPFWRPSDSWFGPSTREGEICYAKYTDARLQLDALIQRPHRAITPISVTNKHKDALVIERLSVPVPLLALYSDADEKLWTEPVMVTRGADDDKAELDLSKASPPEAKDAIKVNEPRVIAEQGTLVRSISSLFS